MSAVISNSIVIIAIVLSLCYSIWRLGPRKMRDAIRARLSKALPSVFGHLNVSTSGSACDACGGGCAPATPAPTTRKEHSVFWRKKAAP